MNAFGNQFFSSAVKDSVMDLQFSIGNLLFDPFLSGADYSLEMQPRRHSWEDGMHSGVTHFRQSWTRLLINSLREHTEKDRNQNKILLNSQVSVTI